MGRLSGFAKRSLPFFSLQTLINGQQDIISAVPKASPTIHTVTINGTATTFRDIFTMPASVDVGADLLPYVHDPAAVDAQNVCPGYKASHVEETDGGLTAVLTLAGAPCNVFGNDVEVLKLNVEYQSANRLAINISPAHTVS